MNVDINFVGTASKLGTQRKVVKEHRGFLGDMLTEMLAKDARNAKFELRKIKDVLICIVQIVNQTGVGFVGKIIMAA